MHIDLRAPLSRKQAAAINAPIIERLAASLEQIFAAAVAGHERYALLDFPNHENIGDSAIYCGELALTRKCFGAEPCQVSDISRPLGRQSLNIADDVVVLLHGGGNFGDLYPQHQRYREWVIKSLPRHRIVVMPQSIHFEDPDNMRRTADVFNRHERLTMMVRDQQSYNFARQFLACELVHAPDAAFMLGPIEPRVEPDLSALALHRADIESVAHDGLFASLPEPYEICDWPNEQRRRSPVNLLPSFLRGKLPPSLQGTRPASPSAFAWLAQRRLDTGLRLLSRGRVVVTDRLHGHILSLLLGIPHIAYDNNYRKIGNFVDQWSHGGAFEKKEI